MLRTATRGTNKMLEETSLTTKPANQIRGGYRGGKDRGRNNSGRGFNNGGKGKTKLICQMCGNNGHTAVMCYHRFNKKYVPSHANN